MASQTCMRASIPIVLVHLFSLASFARGSLWGSQGGREPSEERLIGWRGEAFIDRDDTWDPLDLGASKGSVPLPASSGFIQQLSWEPRAFVYRNLISASEARHLIKIAAPQMKRSTVVGANGSSVEDDYRTSYGTFLRRYQDEVVKRIEHRVAAWTQIPVSHQEDIQVLRYGIGQFYKVHADTLRDPEAGVRVCTVLVYLNEPEEGGETAFPFSGAMPTELAEKAGSLSDCAKGHVAFKPRRGDALLFWSINPDKSEDFHAQHTGCPVIRGVKWTMTKWIHAKPFRPYELARTRLEAPAQTDPGECADTSKQAWCEAEKKKGGCETSKEMMVLSGAYGIGRCRRTCGACSVCEPGDTECYNQNRRQAGYLAFNLSELQPM